MTYSLFVILASVFPYLRCQDATFQVPEEQMNVLVGSIPDGIHLKSILADETLKSLTYSFLSHGYPDSNLFSLNNSTGELRTAVAVDREKICGFQLQCVLVIQVAIQSSSDQYFKKVKLHVLLEDANDNTPEFPTPSATLHISEDVSKNTSYSIDGAIDRDIGKNGLQGYELIDDDGPFFLNISRRLDGGQTISLIVGDGLDREIRSSYKLKIRARDGGYPQKTGEITLNIVVGDVNDNSPRFEPSFYNITVKETVPVHSVIFTVSATDTDSEENGVDFYRFSSMKVGNFEKYITINKKTGEVSVIATLEPVQGESFTFVVECVDKGSPPLVSQALVELNIEDSVNSPPRINFNLLSAGLVSEYALPGTVVAHVAVHDPDYGQNGMIKCFLISNSFELDALDVNEYKVNLMKTLDRELESEVNVTVTCEDSGKPPLKAAIDFSIKIQDENDHSPYFLQDVYTAYLDENLKDVVVTQVTAHDNDVGENGEVEYIIPYGWQIGLSVLPNGDIICNKPFDRESTPKIAVTVIAVDKGKPQRNDSTTVIITINDVNDVTPVFYKQEFTFSIPENQPAGTTFGSVVAFDLDLRDGGELKYYIEEEDGFHMDVSYDGLLRTTTSLDREVRDSYRFRVWVADGGKPILSSSATVIVNVTDENDNYPDIRLPDFINSSLTIPHDTPEGTVVMAVEANDLDADTNGLCQFYILPQNDDITEDNDSQSASMKVLSMFEIHRDSGELRLRKSLTKEDTGFYQLRVLVRDQGMPPLMSNVTLDIHVVLSNHTSGGMNKENATVVAVVGSLTGVFCVIVVIAIVIMRRRDRVKQQYATPRIVSHPAPSNLKPVVEFESRRKDEHDGRNRMSEDESDGSNRSYETDDRQNDEIFNNGVDLDDDRKEISILSEVERHWLADAKTIPDWSTALKLHQDLLKLHGVQTKILPQTHYEDGRSSECSEEVATSDSGRGGSDEDSHGRASPDCKQDDAKENLIVYSMHRTLRSKTANYVNMGYESIPSTPVNIRRKADIWTIDTHGSVPSTPVNVCHTDDIWDIDNQDSVPSTPVNGRRKADSWVVDASGSAPSTPVNGCRKADLWIVDNHGSAPSTPVDGSRKTGAWIGGNRGSAPSTPLNGCRKVDVWMPNSHNSAPSTPIDGRRNTDMQTADNHSNAPETPIIGYRKVNLWNIEKHGSAPTTPVNGCRKVSMWNIEKHGSAPSTPVNSCRKADIWEIDKDGSVPSTPVNGCRKVNMWNIEKYGSPPSTPVDSCRKADIWEIDRDGSVPSTPVNSCRKASRWQVSSQDGYKKRHCHPGPKRVTFQREVCVDSVSVQKELHHTMFKGCRVADDVSQSMDDDDTTTSGSYSVDVDHETIDAMLPRVQDMLV
ncbi:protocadherin-7-like [Gigantopelta aegis]|uniref:protocadherin-7-like n=1 Tax=Gigantopelta aegis TaxID=1735272 RepID=UPI001B88A7B1|nr:protocadherin-7-like [Gigantopelta aegis]